MKRVNKEVGYIAQSYNTLQGRLKLPQKNI